MSNDLHFETKAIQVTHVKDETAGAVSPPIYLSTTFEREVDGSYAHGYVYTRMANPNRLQLEQSLAALENGSVAFCFSSGMAAVNAVLQALKTGDHIIIPDDAYYTVEMLAADVFARWGLQKTKVDMTDLQMVKKAIQPNTRLIWIETPSNPLLKISNIKNITNMTREKGILCVVDNTWATPVFQSPLLYGADVVMHSTTKYFGGHSDVLGGALVLKDNDQLAQNIAAIQKLSGSVPSPIDCWLVLRGIKTLALRVKAQAETAKKLASFLSSHPQVEAVYYPGLTSHPGHTIAAAQMNGGFGAMLSVSIKGSAEDAMNLTGRLKLFTIATSLGGVESLVEHRRSVEGPNSQTPPNLLRVSVGVEHIDDLINDWKQALG
ncbi:MAG TPA: aminotransferase class I/II-fold pyridoxal phosphate-dependent enzyme [Chitinophagaceae bacterium]|nr:aminotransferase class I/II-fold pyridoxal phosphate-dependent enzyme [Chitinophagaceae bacterium]